MDLDTHRSKDEDSILSTTTNTNIGNHKEDSNGNEMKQVDQTFTKPNKLDYKDLITIHLIAGASSKITESFIMFPLDTIKTRLQFQGDHSKGSVRTRYSGIVNAFKSTVATEGMRGFYRGYLPHILYVVPSAAISFVCYEAIVKQIKKTQSNRNVATSFGGGITSTTTDGGLGVIIPVLGMALARVSGSVIRTPFDIIKMRQQVSGSLVNEEKKKTNTNAYKTLKKIVSKDGVGGLFKFSYVSMLRDLPFSAIYFTTYELSRNYQKKLINHNNVSGVKKKLTPINNLIAGGISGAIGTILTIPIDVIKTNLQTQDLLPKNQRRFHGIFSAIKYIVNTEGYRGLTKGLGTRLIHIVPSAGISFASYEYIKKALVLFYSKDKN